MRYLETISDRELITIVSKIVATACEDILFPLEVTEVLENEDGGYDILHENIILYSVWISRSNSQNMRNVSLEFLYSEYLLNCSIAFHLTDFEIWFETCENRDQMLDRNIRVMREKGFLLWITYLKEKFGEQYVVEYISHFKRKYNCDNKLTSEMYSRRVSQILAN